MAITRTVAEVIAGAIRLTGEPSTSTKYHSAAEQIQAYNDMLLEYVTRTNILRASTPGTITPVAGTAVYAWPDGCFRPLRLRVLDLSGKTKIVLCPLNGRSGVLQFGYLQQKGLPDYFDRTLTDFAQYHFLSVPSGVTSYGTIKVDYVKYPTYESNTAHAVETGIPRWVQPFLKYGVACKLLVGNLKDHPGLKKKDYLKAKWEEWINLTKEIDSLNTLYRFEMGAA